MRKLKYVLGGSLLLIGLLTVAVVLTGNTKQPLPTPVPQLPTTQPPVVLHPVASEVAQAVNEERVKAGLAPLVDDPLLDASAAAKCADMVKRNYFAHNDPDTGAEPWVFFTNAGITYKDAGENLAYGFNTSQGVVIGWMASPGHRANILNQVYTHEGLAVCHSDNYQNRGSQYIVVQHFDLPL